MGDNDRRAWRSAHLLPVAVYGALAVAAIVVFLVALRIGIAVEDGFGARTIIAPKTSPVARPAPVAARPVRGMERGPRGNPGQFFSTDNYPAEAIRRNEQGRTVAHLTVSPDGSVSSCSVQQSSGSAALDAATCGISLGRVRFDPARDGAGRPVAGSYMLPVRWVLPQDTGAPAGPVATRDAHPAPQPARSAESDGRSTRPPVRREVPFGSMLVVLIEGFVLARALTKGELARTKHKPVVGRKELPGPYWSALAIHAFIFGAAIFATLSWIEPG